MSGTRDYERMTMKLYPTSNPVHLRDYPIEAGQDRMLNFDSSSSSSSNKFVQYVEASAEASRLFPPLAEEERPPTFQFRQPVVNNNVAEGNESNARHRPPAASSSVSASATSSGSNSKGRVPSHGQKLRAKKHKPEWKDLPYSNDFSIESQFLHFPASVLDQILSDVSLNLRDHLSLAASCRSLRACYYSPSYSSLWRALVALRPPVEQGRLNVKKSTSSSRENERLVRRIWSNGLKVDTEQMQVIQVKEGGGGGAVARPPTDESAAIAIRSKEWDNAIDLVHTIRISKIEAKKLYKLAEKELDNCLASFSTNPNAKGGSNRILYFESAVEALALRLHGGVNGHAKYVARRVETAKKKKSTRDFNAGR